MKALKTIVAIALSAAGLGSAVTLGVVANNEHKVEPVVADSEPTGYLLAKLGNISKWSQSSAKLCAFLTDDTSSYWTSLQTMSSNKNQYVFSYTINFTPTKLIWVRMNSAASSGNWDQKWNQTGDLSVREATYLQDQWDPSASQVSQWTVSAQVRSNTVESFGTKTTLSKLTLNGSGNPEVSGVVTLEENEEFKILSGDNVWSGYYGCPEAIDSCFEGGSKTAVNNDNPNIKCLVPGDYDFYFDTETKRVWLSRQDIVDADGYASYFLNNVGCDATGATVPSGWSTCASTYANLSGAAKDYLCSVEADAEGDNAARCVYWYDYALRAHPNLTAFMVDSSNNPRVASSNQIGAKFNGNSTVVIVVVTGIILTSAVGAFFLLRRKRKEQ